MEVTVGTGSHIDDVASVLEQFDVMLYSVDNAMPVHGVEEKKA
jgi:hypothetical protein